MMLSLKAIFALVALSQLISASPLALNKQDLHGISGRIVNGDLAQPKQFPYQVGLSLDIIKRGKSWCGGILISDRWILTAAHCTQGATAVDVYLGTTNRREENEEGRKVFHVLESGIHEHENYNPTTVENDIALIELPETIDFNEYIQAARLPTRREAVMTFVGEHGVASGWGHISDDKPALTDVLRYIDVPIMPNIDCNQFYPELIRSSNICIATDRSRKSVCHADSGGPLVLLDGVQNNLLIGLTSFGSSRGCESEFPAVFTRTSFYLDWIQKLTGIELE